MERNQVEQIRNNLVAKFEEVGIECKWLMESGGITMKTKWRSQGFFFVA